MRLKDCNCYNYEESGMLMHPPGLTWCGSEDGRLRRLRPQLGCAADESELLILWLNEEEQAVERVEGNGGVVGGLKDGDEASLERIHHLGPTENGQIDFKEM
ncbi:hypothetical protein YC2023_079386 [Brassica napus]